MKKKDIFAFAFIYSVITVILTWPLLIRLGTSVSGPGDPYLNAWILWWDVHGFLKNPLQIFQANIFYPYSGTLAFSENMFTGAFLVSPLTLIFENPFIPYNVLIMFSFVLNALSMAVLGHSLTKNRWASFAAGLIFAFSSYRFHHSGHMQILLSFFMPLSLFYLHRFLQRNLWKDLFCFTGLFICNALSNLHFMVFLFLAAAVLVLFSFSRMSWIDIRSRAGKLIAGGFIFLIVMAPVLRPYAVQKEKYGFWRKSSEISLYSADWKDYWEGDPVSRLYSRAKDIPKKNVEKYLFSGLSVLFLMLMGLGVIIIQSRKKEHWLSGAYPVLIIICLGISLGPGSLLYDMALRIIPGLKGIRSIARIYILILLAQSVLCAEALSFMHRRIKTKKAFLPGLIFCLIFLTENYPVPAFTRHRIGKVDQAYVQWLKKNEQISNILFLPASTMDTSHIIGSVYHQKNIVNGYSGYDPPLMKIIRRIQRNFPSQEMIRLFQILDIDTIIVDKHRYPECRKIKGLFLLRENERSFIFHVRGRDKPAGPEKDSLLKGDITPLLQNTKSGFSWEGLEEFQPSRMSLFSGLHPVILKRSIDRRPETDFLVFIKPGGTFSFLIDLQATVVLSAIRIQDAERKFRHFIPVWVEVSRDGHNWETVYEQQADILQMIDLSQKKPLSAWNSGSMDLIFDACQAHYVRLRTVNDSKRPVCFGFSEIFLYTGQESGFREGPISERPVKKPGFISSEIIFENGIRLSGISLSRADEQHMRIDYQWQIERPVKALPHVHAFVHFYDDKERVVIQDDHRLFYQYKKTEISYGPAMLIESSLLPTEGSDIDGLIMGIGLVNEKTGRRIHILRSSVTDSSNRAIFGKVGDLL